MNRVVTMREAGTATAPVTLQSAWKARPFPSKRISMPLLIGIWQDWQVPGKRAVMIRASIVVRAVVRGVPSSLLPGVYAPRFRGVAPGRLDAITSFCLSVVGFSLTFAT